MARNREERPPRKMKPVYLVFCEGETEEAYINFLRHNYRSPIKIISKIEGSKISKELIQKRIDETKIAENENISTFLMYDLDVEKVNERLEACDSIKLLSNPCIEIWFLLHFVKNMNSMNSNECVQKLKQLGNEWENYTKGSLSEKQKASLWSRKIDAVENAKRLVEFENPSSTVYRLIEMLEEGK